MPHSNEHSDGIAHIEKLSHDGRGIARIQGKTTFIQGALPDEQVSFHYTKRKRDYDQAIVEHVLDASPNRADPRCAQFDICGGCSLQHLAASQQILLKQAWLLDLIKRTGHTEPETVLPPLTADVWHYRNKARLSVRYVEKKQTTLIGFREQNYPRFIADIAQCHILHPLVGNHIKALQALINGFDNPRGIAQIEVAAGDKAIALIFRNLETLSERELEILCQFGQDQGMQIFLQPSGPNSVYRIYPEQECNPLSYELPNHQIKIEFHPTDFTQVNASINRQMVDLALDLLALEKSDQVLDLFCGLGNFSLPMARYCGYVYGIEGSQTMVQRARDNASLNGLMNTEFQAMNLDDVAVLSTLPVDVNKLLLDPPRAGAKLIVEQIHRWSPESIVYISCNPATLARDTEILVHQQGYALKALGSMDMFPHTAHVESIAYFTRRG